jgi:hypothetical protein
MLQGLLHVRANINALVPLVHTYGDSYVIKEEEHEQVVELLIALEKHVFQKGIRQLHHDSLHFAPWGFIMQVTALYGTRTKSMKPILEIVENIMADHSVYLPREKFRVFLRRVVNDRLLDTLFIAFSVLSEDKDVVRIVSAFYTETVFLSKIFLDLFAKVTSMARVIPIQTSTMNTGGPFVNPKKNDAVRQSIRLPSLPCDPMLELSNMAYIEQKIDPLGGHKTRSRGRTVESMLNDLSDIAIMNSYDGALTEVLLVDRTGKNNGENNGSGRKELNASSAISVSSASVMPGGEDDVYLSTLTCVGEVLIANCNQVTCTKLDRVLLEDMSTSKSRSRLYYEDDDDDDDDDDDGDDDGISEANEHDGGEEVKWMREQIQSLKWGANLERMPSQGARSPLLYRAFLESLLCLRYPLLGMTHLESFQLVMEIPNASARIRNIALLCAQAPPGTHSITSALLRLFHLLVADNHLSMSSACICLCPILFGTQHHQQTISNHTDKPSSGSSIFSFRTSTENFGSCIRGESVLVESSRSFYITSLILAHTDEILEICDANR